MEDLAAKMAAAHVFSRPTHYLVLKEEPLSRILSGEKKYERRDIRLAASLCHSEVALACSRDSKTPMAGKVVAWVLFGHVDADDEYSYSDVAIRRVHVLPESEWEECPGGLGLRPMPRRPR